MAQSKLNDFFNNAKSDRSFSDRQSAKRRKLDNLSSSVHETNPDVSIPNIGDQSEQKSNTIFNCNLRPTRISTRSNKGTLKFEFKKETDLQLATPSPGGKNEITSGIASCTKQSSKLSKTSINKTRQKRNTPAKTNRSKSKALDKSQRKLTDLIRSGSTKQETPESSESVNPKLDLDLDIKSDICLKTSIKPEKDAIPSDNDNSERVDVGLKEIADAEPHSQGIISRSTFSAEVTTSIIDDHNHALSGLNTPRKRIITMDNNEVAPKTRVKKLAPRRLSNENVGDSAKKKLEVSLNTAAHSPVQITHSSIVDENSSTDKECTDTSKLTGKSELIDMVASISDPPAALSPLHLTPERQEEETKTVEVTPKLKSLSQKLNTLTNMNNQAKRALKNRLKQSGKLGDVNIKEKLNQLSTALAANKDKLKTEDNVNCASKETGLPLDSIEKSKPEAESLPAHQRFEHLAAEGVPSLDLPFHYRTLDAAFQAMDQIISMMHNRSEMCTFTKLKSAVQNITRKNFEEKAVGQIKAVVPDAYDFRQEKNIPMYGRKISGYQLTIEPRLVVKGGDCFLKTKEGKPLFTGGMLVSRKQEFTSKLISQVKQHHKTFLSTLNPPIQIPNDKIIRRWHPKFQLDKVPEISAVALPTPPNVKVYNTAADVLQHQKGKLNPRVEQALMNVAAANKLAESAANVTISNTSSPSKATPSSPSMKGIPPFLLAKIRAKEAAKIQESLTRDPAEDSKTRMMSHLPDIIRILRSYFITEKKPALPLESVHKKLQESYRSGISMRDVQLHLDLLKDLAPELVTEVEVKRGKFLKLDRNVDVQAVNARIMNKVKTRK